MSIFHNGKLSELNELFFRGSRIKRIKRIWGSRNDARKMHDVPKNGAKVQQKSIWGSRNDARKMHDVKKSGEHFPSPPLRGGWGVSQIRCKGTTKKRDHQILGSRFTTFFTLLNDV